MVFLLIKINLFFFFKRVALAVLLDSLLSQVKELRDKPVILFLTRRCQKLHSEKSAIFQVSSQDFVLCVLIFLISFFLGFSLIPTKSVHILPTVAHYVICGCLSKRSECSVIPATGPK